MIWILCLLSFCFCDSGVLTNTTKSSSLKHKSSLHLLVDNKDNTNKKE